MNHFRLQVLLVCLAVIFLLACESKSNHVRIGGLAPLTGDCAAYGMSARCGFELAVAECNAQGGVLGRPVKLFVSDDKGDPAESATVANLLVHQRRVVGIVGPPMTKTSLAGAPIAQNAHVPMVASSPIHPKVTEVGDYVFRACPTDQYLGSEGARFAYHDLHTRKAACVFDLGNDYPKGLAEVFRATFQKLGGTVVAYEGHTTGTVDFRAQLTKAIKAGPDLLYVPEYYGDVALIVQQARELGFRGPMLGADGWDSPKLVELAGPHLANTYFTTFFSPDDPSPAAQTFVGAYKTKYRNAPDAHATMAYEATVILLDAIRRAGTTEGPAIRDALVRTSLRLVTGPMTFDAKRNPLKYIVIMEIKDGRPAFRGSRPPSLADLPNPAPSALEHTTQSWR